MPRADVRGAGLGIHRCIGSTLARKEMHVAREEWLDKFLGQTAVRATASQLANLIKPT
jgi:cytochrome P450